MIGERMKQGKVLCAKIPTKALSFSPRRLELFLELFNGKKTTATLELTTGKSLPPGSRSSRDGTSEGKVVINNVAHSLGIGCLHALETSNDSQEDGKGHHHSIDGKGTSSADLWKFHIISLHSMGWLTRRSYCWKELLRQTL